MYSSPIPRVAAIHDLSGFGRSSLTVAIPVLSAMGIQVCPLPTAVLSSQTSGVSNFTFHDLTNQMAPILDHWKRLELTFDAVYSGFLGNPVQADLVSRCQLEFKTPGGFSLVDPVLGDNGSLDQTQTPEMVNRMRWLVSRADVITPNLTEAAFLLEEPYDPEIGQDELKTRLVRLSGLGPGRVIITSAPSACLDSMASVAFDREQGRFWRVESPFIPVIYPGTGDTFASVLTGSLLQGDSLPVAMDRAAQFVVLAIRATFGHNSRPIEGILLEKVLGALNLPYSGGSYTIF